MNRACIVLHEASIILIMEQRTKRYRYRAYLTGGQARNAARLFGCCRVVYNKFIEHRDQLYREGRHQDIKMLATIKTVTTDLKRQPGYEFLKEVSSVPLQQSARDAQKAYINWFSSMSGKRKGPKIGKPRFKKRASRQVAQFTRNAGFKVRNESGCKWGWVRLPKIGEIKFALSRDLPSDPSSVTLIRESDDNWYVSFVVEEPVAPVEPATHPNRIASLDVGIGDDLAAIIYSDGTREKINNPKHLRSRARKVRKANKALSRKIKGSSNWHKQRRKLAKVHRKAADARRDHHRKLARRLTVENEVICRETLNLKEMGRKWLARSTYDAGIGTLFLLLDEEAENQGRLVQSAGQWEPTSQTCAVCGTRGGKKPLHVRVWTCQKCSTTLDRDYNAAVNIIVAAGLAETLNACGGDVRRTLACADPYEAGTQRTDRNHTVVAA